MANKFLSSLSRRKTISDEGSPLARVLTLFDLSALGVGSTLGLGVYILAGSVAKTIAGPAVTISFLVAAVASAVAGLCYAEFASRVPKAGSAYVYSYVCVGEFIAFIIGWNLILEYVLGTASVARGLSSYIDALSDNQIKNEQSSWISIDVSFLADYPDFLSLGFVALLTVLLAIGVKESTRLNNLFTVLNLVTVGIVIVSGAIKADPANWSLTKEDIKASNYTKDAGEGGFAPWGVSGIMAGAAKCFFGFVGFDAVATTGEEAKNPQRNIPLAIVISLIIIFVAYFGISTVLTMMWPYYLQDADAPFPHVFEEVGWYTIKWIVTIGAVFALCTSLLGAMFPLPRVIYAMSKDGLVFKALASVNSWTKTPVWATILSGLLSGLMAALFDLDQLIDMMSIGTLLAYTIVAVCVLILRYQPVDDIIYPNLEIKQELSAEKTFYNFIKLIFNLNMNKRPNRSTSLVTNWSIGIFSIFAAAFCAFIIYGLADLSKFYYLTLFVIVTLCLITLLVVIARQPVEEPKIAFKVPWVPVIPCLSVVINLYLMLELNGETWLRFAIWLILGFCIYFLYGIRNSNEGKPVREDDKSETAAMPRESYRQDTKF